MFLQKVEQVGNAILSSDFYWFSTRWKGMQGAFPIFTTSPTTILYMANNCLTPSCKWRPPGTCVYYSGDNISGFNISNGDNLDVIVAKLTAYFSGGTGETPNTFTNSGSATITLSGALNRNIRVDVKIDPQSDNKLILGANGLYASPASFTGSYDGTTLSLNVDGTVRTFEIESGGGGNTVSSFNGRVGAVLPVANDYNWSQIGSKPNSLAGYNIGDPIILSSGSYADPAWITSLSKTKVGLANVPDVDATNASNITSGTLVAARIDASIARLASPALSGTPTAPSPTLGDDSTRIATTEFVQDTIAAVSSGVVTFNGRSGIVTSQTGDYTWAQIDKTTSSLADLSVRNASDLTGTLSDSRLSGNVPLLNINNTFTGTLTLSTLSSGASSVVRASTTGLLSAQTPANLKTDLALVKADVGLGNVVNIDSTNATNISSGTLAEARLPVLTGYAATAGTVTSADTYRQAIQKLDGNITALSTGVTSVFGRTGVVTAQTNDYTWAQINKATSSFADITTRSASDINTGSLADARLSANVPLKNTANTFTDTNNFNTVTVASGSTLSVYNTVDQTTNYERILFNYLSNSAQIFTQYSGTAQNRPLSIGVGGNGATSPFRYLKISPTVAPLFEFVGSTSATGNIVNFNLNLTAGSGEANAFTLSPLLNTTGTSLSRGFFLSPKFNNVGSGGGYVFDIGINSLSNAAGTHTPYMQMSDAGALTINGLAGSGTRIMKASSTGVVSATTLGVSEVSNLQTELDGRVKKIFAQNTQQSVTATTSETTVFTGTIPGGTIGPNGSFEMHYLISGTNNANVKSMRIKFNGTTLSTPVVTGSSSSKLHFWIANRNSLSSQVTGAAGASGSGAGFGSSGGFVQTFSINTAADITFTITLQLANSADTMSLESFTLLAIY